MILKVEFYKKGGCHKRVLDVYDFHVEDRSQKQIGEDPDGSHELLYHTINGKCGALRLGHNNKEGCRDHIYVMEGGKTSDHMSF